MEHIANESPAVVAFISRRDLLRRAHDTYMDPAALRDLVAFVADEYHLPVLEVAFDPIRPVGSLFHAHGGIRNGRPLVHLPHPTQCSLGVVLHELAHCLTPHADHGPAFAAMFNELLELTEHGWPSRG